MVISGIVMAGRTNQMGELRDAVNEIPWAEAHFSDSIGRLVVTTEAADIDESMDRLKELQALPQAVMAELSQYYMEDETIEAGDARR
jgi:nitrate reductase NapAB chaperone NapD